MKIGILADVHEEIPRLCEAIEQLQTHRVDQMVFLGDLCAMGRQIPQTARILQQAGVVGVWGNHDLGLCREIPPKLLAKYPQELFDYTTSLQPRLVLADCHFCHVDPWLNPEIPVELWWIGGPPYTPERVAQAFEAVPERHLFVGHYHRWMYCTADGPQAWKGEQPLVLDAPRTFVVVHAVSDGHVAIFDTEQQLLTPLQLTAPLQGDCD